MGLYDIIIIPCPNCGHEEHHETKDDSCHLRQFTLEEAPSRVLESLKNQSFECLLCSAKFKIRIDYEDRIVQYPKAHVEKITVP